MMKDKKTGLHLRYQRKPSLTADVGDASKPMIALAPYRGLSTSDVKIVSDIFEHFFDAHIMVMKTAPLPSAAYYQPRNDTVRRSSCSIYGAASQKQIGGGAILRLAQKKRSCESLA